MIFFRGYQSKAEVDEVVADHAESYPTPDPGLTLVATSIQTVASLQQADASFGAGAPLLAIAEPSSLLMLFAVGAFGVAIGDRDPFDP